MTDKEISNLNEEEFDRFLEESIEKPPEYLSGSVTPWRRAMNRILWGTGLTMMTLNFLALDVILPTIGRIMLLLGFRTLRRENNWFRAAYACSWLRLVWCLVSFAAGLAAAPPAWLQSFLTVSGYIMLIPQFITILAIRNGIRAVQQKAGLPPHGGNGLLVWFFILLPLALLNYSGILAWGFLIAYPFLLHSLYKLARELDEAGYCITPCPVKVGDGVLKLGYCAAIGICLFIGYGLLGKYPMDWQPAEPVPASQVRQELEALGFPGDVLDDMTEEEILSCQGAALILTETTSGRMLDGIVADTSGADDPLKITSIALQFPGDRDRWKIIYHFHWQVAPGFCGTEALQLWPAESSGCWTVKGGFRGRLLYSEEGQTLTAPYYSLGRETYENTGPLSGILGQTDSTDVFATFSFPADASHARGYVMYDILETKENGLADAWCNYIHQHSRFQYPVQTAVEFRQSYFGSHNEAFYVIYYQFLFRPYGEPEII